VYVYFLFLDTVNEETASSSCVSIRLLDTSLFCFFQKVSEDSMLNAPVCFGWGSGSHLRRGTKVSLETHMFFNLFGSYPFEFFGVRWFVVYYTYIAYM